MVSEPEVERHTFGEGTMVLDSRCFPVLITVASGQTGMDGARTLCRWMDQMVEKAVEHDVRLVTISHSLSTKRPNEDEIRLIMQRADAREERAPGRVITGLVVVEGALMRGVVAVALWMSRNAIKISTVSSMRKAGARARLLLKAAGTEPPSNLDEVIGEINDRSKAS